MGNREGGGPDITGPSAVESSAGRARLGVAALSAASAATVTVMRCFMTVRSPSNASPVSSDEELWTSLETQNGDLFESGSKIWTLQEI